MTSTLSVSLIAADETSALERVARTLTKLEGFEPTGRVAVKSARHAPTRSRFRTSAVT